MPTYVYGCDNPDHPRREVVHRVDEELDVVCEVCGGIMHRIPQPFNFYQNPSDVRFEELSQQMEKKYSRRRRK